MGFHFRDLCKNMIIKFNGLFAHKALHKLTWIHLTRDLLSIVDYIIQRQNHKLKTTDQITDLLMAKTMVNFKKTNKTEDMWNKNQNNAVDKTKCNLESLKQDSVKFLYKLRLITKLQIVQEENMSAEELYKCIKTCIHGAAK